MSQQIYRSFEEPKREGLTWKELWEGEDIGLIICWETGREIREKDPYLAKRVENGELPVLVWKGGVEKRTKTGTKFGTLNYVATWQGLRGDDLNIDLSQDIELTCSRTGMKVIYTADLSKFANE